MPIFNSLGSNYNLSYVLKSLFLKGQNKHLADLKKLLEQKYKGEVILTYKGREALTLALKIMNLPKSSGVAINGFTCVAVYKAVEAAGHKPICLDLEKDSSLNFSPKTLRKTLKENENIKVVVVQNTLGFPCDIKSIKKICQENNIVLIEDLAHCVGAKYESGEEAGNIGDFVILSFSQDKIIDAVSGGALVIRSKRTKYRNDFVFKQPKNQLIDRLYPSFTYKIRLLYNFGLGKSYHFLLKFLNLLSNPMREDVYDFYSLPNWYCGLVLLQFDNLSRQLAHRRKIAQIYTQSLAKKALFEQITRNILLSSNLRFPIFVKKRAQLVKFLKKNSIFVSDIWYDDVAPECPNAVAVSKKILNLPTHTNVNGKQALRICKLVNNFINEETVRS